MNIQSMTVNNPKLIFAALALTSTLASGTATALEDYAEAVGVFDWIPSPLTREDPGFRSVQNHYVHSIVITLQSNGRYKMVLRLPEDLVAGSEKIITLVEVARRPAENEFDFAGPNGSFTCYASGTWMDTSCKVSFSDLGTTAIQNQAFLSGKYAGTRRDFGQALLATGINAEPFGDVRFSDPQFLVEGAIQGNGHWKTSTTMSDGSIIASTIFFDFDKGMIKQGTVNGTVGGIIYTDNTMEAGWNLGDENRWMLITFTGHSFSGTWGDYDSPSPVGTITGSFLKP